MGDDVTAGEVTALAREMSLKFAWLNIPRGGAKAGIRVGNLPVELHESVLHEFGHAISDLVRSGQYVPGMDLGVGDREYRAIMRGAGVPVDDANADPVIDSNYYTAKTVFLSTCAALEHSGRSVRGADILIEGLGKVGRHLVQLFANAGARIVGISTIEGALVDAEGLDVAQLLALADKHADDCVHHVEGLTALPAAQLYCAGADVLIPGARVHSIRPEAVASLKVGFVVSLANAVANRDAESAMHERGIVFVPGFVANSGGIFCWYLARFDESTRDGLLENGFASKVRCLLQGAEDTGCSIATFGRDEAERKSARLRAELAGNTWERLGGVLRKSAPARVGYLTLRRLRGMDWARRDSQYLRWYFDAKYFS
jgi:glutamate dehydrogenase/leucine dehydrogenase